MASSDISSNSVLTLPEKCVYNASVHVRMGFIRRTFGIFTFHYFITSVITSGIILFPLVRFYVNENTWLIMITFPLFMVSYFVLLLKREEKVINFILLILHIAVQAALIAIIVTWNDSFAALQAFEISAFLYFVVFLFTFQFKTDYNSLLIFIICLILIFPAAGSLQAFLGTTEEEVILSVVISIVLLFFHIYGINKIMKWQSPDEYILAVINLYLLPFKVFGLN
ncbi:protein lifeguard 1-like isoform X2 [Stegodyphus dumicola]|nr:protein lifeguard 1-like isoform X2 [Stegodyphus dumicola]XP_035210288.1 protein lifeguard 1-like isoform X2 [Stegodyphus dumicola]XP_035210289.1 protein lifeguard 1-like isoform X2 [Stegodyphus dumicola]XP_035210290.1 protein lifeguard 1-like isoform X2 [Stegodyphus dumicola]